MSQPCIVIAHPVRHPELVTVAADQIAATVAAWFDPPPPGADPEDGRRFARVALVCEDLQAACRPGARGGAVIEPCRALGVFVCAAAPPGVVEPADPWSASHPSQERARAWVIERIERHRAATTRARQSPRPR